MYACTVHKLLLLTEVRVVELSQVSSSRVNTTAFCRASSVNDEQMNIYRAWEIRKVIHKMVGLNELRLECCLVDRHFH